MVRGCMNEESFDDEGMLRDFLLGQSPAYLTDLLVHVAKTHVSIRRMIIQKARLASGEAVEEALRATIEAATEYDGRGFMSWQEELCMLDALDVWIEDLVSVCEPDSTLPLLALVEYGLERVDLAMQHSEEGCEMISALEKLADLHYRVCLMLQPDPLELAQRLLQSGSACEIYFSHDIDRYASLLGAAGLRRYHELAAASTGV